MEDEKKFPWPLPTREEVERMADDYFNWLYSWQDEVRKRYGKGNY